VKKPARRNFSGQAVVEMVLALPLLLLMAAGIAQFSQLFLARVQFEHACGEAAREYAAGSIASSSFAREVWNNLGPYRSRFDLDSIQVSLDPPVAFPSQSGNSIPGLSMFTSAAHVAFGKALDYEKGKWWVTANCRAIPFFGLLFKDGVPFKTQLAVLRHPKGRI